MNTPRKPELPPKLAASAASVRLVDGDNLQTTLFESAAFAGDATRDIGLEECQLTGCELVSQRIKQLQLTDVLIERSHLYGLNIDGTGWRRVMVRGTQAAGLIASASHFEDVVFEDTKLDGANFRLTKLRRVVFRRCSLVGADFSGATMAHVHFDNCELDEVSFDRVTANYTSLVGSQLGRINGLAGLRGITVSSPQLYELAPQLAHELGLEVETAESGDN